MKLSWQQFSHRHMEVFSAEATTTWLRNFKGQFSALWGGCESHCMLSENRVSLKFTQQHTYFPVNESAPFKSSPRMTKAVVSVSNVVQSWRNVTQYYLETYSIFSKRSNVTHFTIQPVLFLIVVNSWLQCNNQQYWLLSHWCVACRSTSSCLGYTSFFFSAFITKFTNVSVITCCILSFSV